MQLSLIPVTINLINLFLICKLMLGYDLRKKQGKLVTVIGIAAAYLLISVTCTDLIFGIAMAAYNGQPDVINMDIINGAVGIFFTTAIILISYILTDKKETIRRIVESIHPITFLVFAAALEIMHRSSTYSDLIDADTAMIIKGENITKYAITTILVIGFLMMILIASHQRNELKRKKVLREQYVAKQTAHYQLMGLANRDLRKFRHDFNKHIDVLSDLADSGNDKELIEYIHQLNNAKENLHGIK